jgi:hypothetical protein
MPRTDVPVFIPRGTKVRNYVGALLPFLTFVAVSVNAEQTELPSGKRTLLLYHNPTGGNLNAEVKSVQNRNTRVLDQNFQLNAADAALMGTFDQPGFLQAVEKKLFMIGGTGLEVTAIQLTREQTRR